MVSKRLKGFISNTYVLLIYVSIGFIIGFMSYTPVSVVENLIVLTDSILDSERYYPNMDWQGCPEDMEVISYHLDDTRVYTNGNGVLIKDVHLSNVAGTGSMQPMMTKGTRTVVERYDGQELHVGMIIVTKPSYADYEENQARGVVHRIVKIDGDTIITKGDDNRICESWDRDYVNYIVRGVLF